MPNIDIRYAEFCHSPTREATSSPYSAITKHRNYGACNEYLAQAVCMNRIFKYASHVVLKGNAIAFGA